MRVADGEGAGEAIDPRALFARFAGERAMALAVSGGADSLALLLLAAAWRDASAQKVRLLVLCVDHGLRAEAAAEAAMVGDVAARFGLDCRVLRADQALPDSDVEAAARAMRYRLLAEAARAEGISLILTAHHADDQAETLLLRLARGSGVYGLSAMAAETAAGDSIIGAGEGCLRIARPLLGLRQADLAAFVRRAGLSPAKDPHNVDDRFARARLRKLMPRLAAEGLDVPRLVTTAARLRRAASAIDDYVDRLFARAARVDMVGAVRLETAAFLGEPEEARLRALARILRAAGGGGYTPRLRGLEPLHAAMLGDAPLRRTLGGVLVDRRKGDFRFQREAGRVGLAARMLPAGSFAGVYDGRFRISAEMPAPGYRIAALGAAGRRSLAACLVDGLPEAIAASPALLLGDTLIAAPLLGREPPAAFHGRIAMEAIVSSRLMMRVQDEDP